MVLYKPIPSGTDAYTYVHSAMWMQDNHKLVKKYQDTYAGAKAYVAPINEINLFLMGEETISDISYPIMSFYQIILIIALILSLMSLGYIITSSYRVALLSAFFILGNYGIFRLFIGSSVSNFLAFVIINIFCIILFYLKKSFHYFHLICLFFLLFALIVVHRYFTAPLFIITLIIYIVIYSLINNNFRDKITFFYHKYRTFTFFVCSIILFLLLILILIFKAPFTEALNSYFDENIKDSFIKEIPIYDYYYNIGSLLYFIGIVSFIVFPFVFRKYWKDLEILWLFVLLMLIFPITYYFGFYFNFDRILFLTIPYFSLFAAILCDFFLKRFHFLASSLLLIIIIFTLTINGVYTNIDLYKNSNLVFPEHIETLKFINSHTDLDEIIITNKNSISDTRHDRIISHRKFYVFSSDPKLIDEISGNKNKKETNKIIQEPDSKSSLSFLCKNNIQYIFLVKNKEAKEEVDRIIEQYKNSENYILVNSNKYTYLFKLKK
jgi:hypothetical protein